MCVLNLPLSSQAILDKGKDAETGGRRKSGGRSEWGVEMAQNKPNVESQQKCDKDALPYIRRRIDLAESGRERQLPFAEEATDHNRRRTDAAERLREFNCKTQKALGKRGPQAPRKDTGRRQQKRK